MACVPEERLAAPKWSNDDGDIGLCERVGMKMCLSCAHDDNVGVCFVLQCDHVCDHILVVCMDDNGDLTPGSTLVDGMRRLLGSEELSEFLDL